MQLASAYRHLGREAYIISKIKATFLKSSLFDASLKFVKNNEPFRKIED
jgi:hypothetical protein